MNITPYSEGTQVGEGYLGKDLPERLEWLLQGRSPWKWADSVQLSSGAMQRLLKGHFPDPEKLIPASRIENFSLTWFVEGRGTPYGIAHPVDDDDAATILQLLLTDEPDTDLLICYCDKGYTVIAWTLVQTQTTDGKPYQYNATTILGGGAAGPRTIATIREMKHPFTGVHRNRSLQLERAEWHNLAQGLIGNHKIFGDGGYVSRSTKGHQPVEMHIRYPEVRESIQWADSQETAALRILRDLNTPDRLAALRMLKGLRDAKP